MFSVFAVLFAVLALASAYTGDQWRNRAANPPPTVDCKTTHANALAKTTDETSPADWIPDCEKDGSFKRLQRNSSGFPFCSSSKGVMVFQPHDVSKTTQLSCDCPVQVYDILSSKHRQAGEFVPFCKKDGKFRPVQCMPGNPKAERGAPVAQRISSCFCADEKGNKLGNKPRGTSDAYCVDMRHRHL